MQLDGYKYNCRERLLIFSGPERKVDWLIWCDKNLLHKIGSFSGDFYFLCAWEVMIKIHLLQYSTFVTVILEDVHSIFSRSLCMLNLCAAAFTLIWRHLIQTCALLNVIWNQTYIQVTRVLIQTWNRQQFFFFHQPNEGTFGFIL